MPRWVASWKCRPGWPRWLKIPEGTQTGKQFRLRGKVAPVRGAAGDLLSGRGGDAGQPEQASREMLRGSRHPAGDTSHSPPPVAVEGVKRFFGDV